MHLNGGNCGSWVLQIENPIGSEFSEMKVKFISTYIEWKVFKQKYQVF